MARWSTASTSTFSPDDDNCTLEIERMVLTTATTRDDATVAA
jgi:hypothetical protein